MDKLKRCLSVAMVIAMLCSLLYVPVNAANRSETIQLSLELLNGDMEPLESGVQKDGLFAAALRFSGNPTTTHQNKDGNVVPDGITSLGIYIQYDSAIATPPDDNPLISDGALLATPTYKVGIANNTSLLGWASESGITRTEGSGLNKRQVPCESGIMTYLVFSATKDASLSELQQAVKILASALIPENGQDVQKPTLLTDIDGNNFLLGLGEDETRKITVTPAEHGTVTPDKTTAKKDETVTLTIAPDTGYQLKDGTLKAEGAADAPTKTGENVYTFKMGTSDVTVSAQFEQKPDETLKVTVTPAEHGTVTPDKTTAKKDETVTLTIAPDTGYQLKDGTLKAEGAADAPTKTGENVYTFKMGTSDVTVSAQFEQKPDETRKITVTCTPTEGGTAVPSKTTAQEGDVVELTVTPKTAGGYVFDLLTVTDDDGKIETTRSNAVTSGTSIIFTFTVRKSDVKVEAKFKPGDGEAKPIQILSSIPAEGGTVESDKSEAVKDEEVTLKVTPDLNKGYVLKELTVTGSDGTKVTPQMKENSNTTYAFSEHSFKMPDLPSDGFVTVQAKFAIPRLVTLPEKVEHGSVSSDKQPTAYVGETVTLTVTPDTNCQLKAGFPKVTKTDGTAITLNKADEKTYTFVMENSDATVSVEFEPVKREITVTYAAGDGSGNSKTTTEQLPFKLPSNPGFTLPSDKTFDGWTLPNGKFYAVGAEISELANNSIITAHYSGGGGCYVATAVYGSYDCPEVWTLRRFRDHVLAQTWYGRLFIKLYYAVSPTAVKLFGDSDWFQNFWRGKLDSMVSNLQADGFESTPYQDMDW